MYEGIHQTKLGAYVCLSVHMFVANITTKGQVRLFIFLKDVFSSHLLLTFVTYYTHTYNFTLSMMTKTFILCNIFVEKGWMAAYEHENNTDYDESLLYMAHECGLSSYAYARLERFKDDAPPIHLLFIPFYEKKASTRKRAKLQLITNYRT